MPCAGCLRAWWRGCMAAGLVGGEGFSIDASLIKADVDKKKRVPGDQPTVWPKAEEASRAVREYLLALDAAQSDEESGGGDDAVMSGGGSRRNPYHSLLIPGCDLDLLAGWPNHTSLHFRPAEPGTPVANRGCDSRLSLIGILRSASPWAQESAQYTRSPGHGAPELG